MEDAFDAGYACCADDEVGYTKTQEWLDEHKKHYPQTYGHLTLEDVNKPVPDKQEFIKKGIEL